MRRHAYSEILKIALAAVLMCLYVILNRFVSIYLPLGGMPSVRIGFSSVPIVFASLACGPIWGAVAGAGGDLIGAFAFPNGSGAYLYGYTIDQALLGVIPWVLMRIFKGHRRALGAFDILVSLLGIGAFFGLVIPDAAEGKYQIPLDLGGRIGLGVGVVALALISGGLTVFFSRRMFGEGDDLPLRVRQALKVRIRGLSGCSNKGIKRAIRRDGLGLMRLDLNAIASYGVDDISKSRNIGWKLFKASFSIHELKHIYVGGKPEKKVFSFLDIYSILLFEMITVKTLLLAFWGQLYFSIPYAYGVFSDLLTGIISLPILAVVTYAVMLPLANLGLFDLDSVKRSKRGRKR